MSVPLECPVALTMGLLWYSLYVEKIFLLVGNISTDFISILAYYFAMVYEKSFVLSSALLMVSKKSSKRSRSIYLIAVFMLLQYPIIRDSMLV